MDNIMESREVDYNDNKYIVIKCIHNDKTQLSIIDYDNKDVLENTLYVKSSYIAKPIIINNIKKDIYIHNYVMNKLTFNGKGQTNTVDHINRIPTDNRKENLRFLSQSHQNMNQTKREREIKLPTDCGIDVNNIPKNVYYHRSNNGFGEFFEIDIKKMPDGSRFRKKSSKSKNISLKCKLEEIKKILNNLTNKYPTLLDDRNIISEYSDKAIELIKSYNGIIKLSNFDSWEDNIIPIPEQKKYTEIKLELLNEKERKIVENIGENNNYKNKTTNNLPENCKITKYMIPKYCYYAPPRNAHGDLFVIYKHPLLIKLTNKKTWNTPSLKNMTTNEKFFILYQKLNELYDIYYNSTLIK